ncbi:MAG: exodeoxyribonuclease V subunit gamma [Acidobacteria bacterium]|nr:exodeoxyribonuclease V subunit gamma [Acidobacteriota bacterium]
MRAIESSPDKLLATIISARYETATVMALIITQSNRLERLGEALGVWLRHPAPLPLEQDIVVVQSNAMATWLSREIAKDSGICACVSFPFPRALITDLVTSVLGTDAMSRFGRDRLVWDVLEALKQRLSMPLYEPIRASMGESPDRRLQFAAKMAHLFEQYTVYRMDMLAHWEQQSSKDWQSDLWRTVTEHLRESPVRLVQSFVTALPSASLPRRISVFAPPTLSPLYLQILRAVSDHCLVHVFVHAPSAFFWGHTNTSRTKRDHADSDLLGAYGLVGRDFQSMLEAEPYIQADVDFFEEPSRETLLGRIQSDIFHARPMAEIERVPMLSDDTSVQCHSCHSSTREVEVLRDRLLHLFETTDVAPHEVLVMAPDINQYAPIIESVFGHDPKHPLFIPFTVSDRAQSDDSPVISGFLKLLQLCSSRLGAPEVMDFLAHPPISQKFGLEADDLDQISNWLMNCGLRWGRDRQHRHQLDQPGNDAHTWQFALDRLFIGYCFPGRDYRLFHDRLGYDHVEGMDMNLLGRLSQFTEVLMAAHRDASSILSMSAWCDLMDRFITDFFEPDHHSAYEIYCLRQVVQEMRVHAPASGDLFSIATVIWFIKRQLAESVVRSRFMNHGVSFCALLPMRALPFRVICLLGLNESTFPRNEVRDTFDHMAQNRRIGDRSQRNDDLYLFLETILSAREKLWLFYVGQSLKDNRSMPPSVVVCALWDAIAARTTTANGADLIWDRLVVRHPLQRFSRHYFERTDPRLFSFVVEHASVAQKRSSPPSPPPPLCRESLDIKPPETVDLSALVRFFKDPVDAFLRQQLGVSTRLHHRELVQDELIALDPLSRSDAAKLLIRNKLFHIPAGREILSAKGMLPHGSLGERVYLDLERIVIPMYHELQMHWYEPRQAPKQIQVHLDGVVLSGSIADWVGGTLVRFNVANPTGKHLLATWIQLLAIASFESFDWQARHVFYEKNKDRIKIKTYLMKVPDHPQDLLQRIVQIYQRGLQKPVPLRPELGWKLVAREDHDLMDRFVKALEGESDEFWVRFFPEPSSVAQEFCDLVRDVFEPLQAYCHVQS